MNPILDLSFVTRNVTISVMLEVQLREFPKSYKEIARKMELINGKYDGVYGNCELAMFCYAAGGSTLKFIRKLGDYYIFRSSFTLHVELNYSGLNPYFPFSWKFSGEDAGIFPTVLIDFGVEISPTMLHTEPLDVALHTISNGVIDAGNSDFRLFKNLNFGLTGYNDDYIITKA